MTIASTSLLGHVEISSGKKQQNGIGRRRKTKYDSNNKSNTYIKKIVLFVPQLHSFAFTTPTDLRAPLHPYTVTENKVRMRNAP